MIQPNLAASAAAAISCPWAGCVVPPGGARAINHQRRSTDRA